MSKEFIVKRREREKEYRVQGARVFQQGREKKRKKQTKRPTRRRYSSIRDQGLFNLFSMLVIGRTLQTYIDLIVPRHSRNYDPNKSFRYSVFGSNVTGIFFLTKPSSINTSILIKCFIELTIVLFARVSICK